MLRFHDCDNLRVEDFENDSKTCNEETTIDFYSVISRHRREVPWNEKRAGTL